MTNEQWLEIFKHIGKKMRDGLSVILGQGRRHRAAGQGSGRGQDLSRGQVGGGHHYRGAREGAGRGERLRSSPKSSASGNSARAGRSCSWTPSTGATTRRAAIPFFSTSLALLNGETLDTLAVGYVINLAAGDEFWALRGKGAYKNGARIRTSAAQGISSSPTRLVAGDGYPAAHAAFAQAKRTRCFGSTALDLAYLASGAISVFVFATGRKSVSGLCEGMPGTRVSRRGGARFHGPRPRVAGRFLLPDGSRSWQGLAEAGREYVDLGFPGDGRLGGGGVREFRACFLRAFGVPLPSGDVEGVQGGAGGGVGCGGDRVQRR